jgi:uncharacterized cupredoxin-like copper-binding protein
MLGLAGGLIGLALLLSACGGGNPSLNVELKDFSFAPATFTVPAGKQVTLNVKNTGANEHEFVIFKEGLEATAPFDADDEGNIYWEVETEAGESKTVTFTAPSKPGVYQLVCGVPGHIEHGMVGTLTVQ